MEEKKIEKVANAVAVTIYITAIIAFICLLLCGCCPCRRLGTNTTQRDSVRVDTREVYIERIDTAYVSVPYEVVRNVTRDTTSTVKTSLATSTATVIDGMLWHSISSKDCTVPVTVVTKEVVRDTTIYRDKLREATNTVEVARQLTKWQRLQIGGFWVLLASALSIAFFAILGKKLRK